MDLTLHGAPHFGRRGVHRNGLMLLLVLNFPPEVLVVIRFDQGHFAQHLIDGSAPDLNLHIINHFILANKIIIFCTAPTAHFFLISQSWQDGDFLVFNNFNNSLKHTILNNPICHSPMHDSIQIQITDQAKKVSFQTEQSVQTGSTRRKYYLKKSMLQNSMVKPSAHKSNIFDLTSTINNSYSEVNSPSNSAAQSRLYTNSLFASPSKDTLVDNPETKFVLPIITESKYNFRPVLALPKVKMQGVHAKAPFYVHSAAKIDEFNIKQMKKYKKMWARSAQLRQDKSLLERSIEKAEKYIQKHNSQFLKRKASIDFETILRDRHIKQENRIGECKPIPNRSLAGLKGKGGSVQSLFQQVYAVEEVYKISK